MRITPLILCVSLGACAVGDDYTMPDIKLPESWQGVLGNEVTILPDATLNHHWWREFNDSLLDDMMKRALKNNKDLTIAQARLLEARANHRQALSALLPDIIAGGSAERADRGIMNQNSTINLYETTFDAAWEIDLFGGNRRRYASFEALSEAQEAEYDQVMISLTAEVARNYIEARSAQAHIAITEKNISSHKELLDLIESRHKAGLASDADVASARMQYLTILSRLPNYRTAFQLAIGRLNSLIGDMPGAIDEMMAANKPLPSLSADMVMMTPAQVIQNRPDIRAAERRLASRTELQGAAFAELFPRISLSGMYGFQNASTLPSGAIWAAASGVSMPVFNFGRIRAQIDAADARQQEALATYEKSILLALEETQNALTSYINEENRRSSLASALENAQKNTQLTYDRYTQGIAAYIDVLQAQQSAFNSEIALAETQAMTLKNAIALFKAIGGVNGKEPTPEVVGPLPTEMRQVSAYSADTAAAPPAALAPTLPDNAPTPAVPETPEVVPAPAHWFLF